MVHKGFVRDLVLDKPSLNNNLSDAQRLELCLKEELGIDKIRISLKQLRSLPSQLRAWGYRARAVFFRDRHAWILVGLIDPEIDKPVLGAAVDLGTTRVVISLVDLESGHELSQCSFDNPQSQVGPDVLTRIHHSNQPGGLDELKDLIVEGVNRHLKIMCRDCGFVTEDVYLIAGAGNTSMTHLFLGIQAFEIIKEPYIPCVNIPDTMHAKDLGLSIHENGQVFLFPNIGSYFGGDLIAGIIHADLDKKKEPCLMVDVGTNAEIVVGSSEWLIACAGAAGPALESGVSKMGMTAKPGVIDKVWLDDDQEICIHTIDEKPAIGICGSGMIDLAACLFLSKCIDIRGKFSQAVCKNRLFTKDGIVYFKLVDKDASGTGQPICLSQIDLNSLTSSKAAMYTILEVIVKNTAGLDFEDLAKFYVAGTFGSFIDPVSAISIGMLPDIKLSTFEVLGNSSLGGAKKMLTDPDIFDRLLEVRQAITYIELNVNQEFMNMFSGAKFYPHTDRSRFPSLAGKI